MYVKVPVSRNKKALIFYPDNFLKNEPTEIKKEHIVLNPIQNKENQKILDQYNKLNNVQQDKIVNSLKTQIQEYQSKIQELEKSYNKKTSQDKQLVMNNCNRKIQLLDKEKNELKDRNKSVLEKLDELQNIKKQHDEILIELKDNNNKVNILQNDLLKCQKDYKNTNLSNSIKQEYSKLLGEIETYKNQQNLLESQLKDSKNTIVQNKKDFDLELEKFNGISQLYDDCKINIQEYTSQIKQLKSNYNSSESNKQNILVDIETFNNQQNLLESQLKESKNTIVQNKKDFDLELEKFNEMSELYDDCKISIQEYNSQIKQLKSDYDHTLKSLQDLQTKYNNLVQKKYTLDSNSNELKTLLNSLQDENKKVTNDLEKQLLLNKTQIENIKQLESNIAQLSSIKNKNEQEIYNLSITLKNSEEKLQQQILLLQDCQRKNSESTSSLEQEFNENLSTLQKSLDGQNFKVQDLENLLKTCNDKSNNNVDTTLVLEKELNLEKQKVLALEEKIKQFDQKQDDQKQDLNTDIINENDKNFILHQQNIFSTLDSTIQNIIQNSPDVNKLQIDAINFLNINKNLYYRDITVKNIQDTYDKVYQLKDDLMNFYEDIQSSVRVFIRIKGGSNQPDNFTVDNNLVSSKCQLKNSNYGPFFGVLPSSFNNKDMYTGCIGTTISNNGEIKSHQVSDYQDQKCCILSDTAGFCRVVDQLKSNYHVILLSYGHSGSGKTYTLFGNSQDPGLFQLSLANSGATHFKINGIKELSVGDMDFRPNGLQSSKITTHMITKKYSTKIDNNYDNVLGVLGLLDHINTIRLSKNNILATPNNPFSSRSHLFIELELFFPNNHSSKITFCDLGGRESPFELLKMFYEIPENESNLQFASLLLPTTNNTTSPYPKHNFTLDDPLISWFTGTNDEKNQFVNNLNNVDIRKILQQSLFINETLNHFEYFVKNNQNQKFDYNQIAEEKNFISRTSKGITENTYDLNKFLVKKPQYDIGYKNNTRNNTDPMKMFSLLYDLFNSSNLKSKLVMICNVRPETKYCKVTNETLEFAHNIKST